jgi:hypothetical protein
MRRLLISGIFTFLIFSVGLCLGQAPQDETAAPSLGDLARQLPKQRPKADQKRKVFTNDNLPARETVESPAPAAGTGATSGERKWVKLDSVRPGSTQRSELSREQLVRVRRIQGTLAEVDKSSFEKWVDDFKRDLHPEREIVIWEYIAAAYDAYCSTRTLTLAEKGDVYGILILRSGAPEDEVLKHPQWKVLTPEEAKRVMSYYTGPTQPILVAR